MYNSNIAFNDCALTISGTGYISVNVINTI